MGNSCFSGGDVVDTWWCIKGGMIWSCFGGGDVVVSRLVGFGVA